MPTSKGFTGQYADTTSSGLDYYGARYYDPSLGQFTSADTTNDGINRYGYVKGNPETFTDPTGHFLDSGAGSGGGGSRPSRWTDWRTYIQQHINDKGNLPPIVDDQRMFKGNLKKIFDWPGERTAAENKETEDADVISRYLGLSVIIQDEGYGNNVGNRPPRADYAVGILDLGFKFNRWGAGTNWNGGPTYMDAYYPKVDTNESGIDKEVREKAGSQAPIVVVDISQNSYLQQLYAQQLADPNNPALDNFGAKLTNQSRNLTVPQRVIFIDNGYVVSDVGDFGPTPVNIA